MDFIGQPGGDGSKISLFHGGPDVDILFHLLQHLYAVGAAQGIAGEVADAAEGPVAVLQGAALVIRHIHAKHFLIQPVPFARDVRHLQVTGNHSLFQLIADHDMQGIGQFIRFCPDQGGFGQVDGGVQRVFRDVLHLGGEDFLHDLQQGSAEGAAAADQVLIEPGLAFMDAHGYAAGEACELQVIPHVQLIQGMTAFMDHAVQAGERIILEIVGGDADIPLVGVAGEGMLGFTQGAVQGINAFQGHDLLGEQALIVDGPGAFHKGGNRLLPGSNFLNDRGQFLPQGAEEGVQGRHGGAFFKLIQQDVIGGFGRILQGGKTAAEGHDLLQVGSEQIPVALFLRVMPDGAGFVCQLLIGDKLLHGENVVFIIVFLQQFRLAEGNLVDFLFMLQDGVQHFAGFRVNQLFIGQLGQVSQGHAAAFPGVLGCDGVAVHIQYALGVAQGIGRFLQFFKFCDSFG